VSRIGVFICHCGENIAGVVDCPRVAETLREHPGVAYATDYKYMCSDPGQRLIKEAIEEHKLTGVVVAACSPRMHEPTFRTACAEQGLNPFLCEMANIREHCSWVHEDKAAATTKAIELVRMMVEKVKYNQALEPIRVPVTKRALVIGGGIAGIQAALDIANAGHEVVLVEREPSIGGHMLQLSETFPTLDCSQCILTPKMVDVARHPLITLYTWSEVEKVDGYIGNFEVTIRKKARSVDLDKCTGCGACMQKCPSKKVPSEFEQGLVIPDPANPKKRLGYRTAIYTPCPQAVPNQPVIDREHCIWFTKGKCGVCAKICPTGAIDYEQEDELVVEKIGAIVVATGYQVWSVAKAAEDYPYLGYGEYGYGAHPDIIDGLQFERLLSASGPTGGKVMRPSDGREPESVVFLSCVGSRDNEKGFTYCSKICCMYLAKHAMLYRHKVHHGQAYNFYMDLRAGGKTYDEFSRRTIEEDDCIYLRGRVSRIYPRGDKLVVQGSDTLSNAQVEVEADLVVLATAMIPQPDAEALAQKLRIAYDKDGFYSEAHPKLRPVESQTAGVYLCGACQGPKDIPEAVAQASGAASKVSALFSADELEREPVVAEVHRADPPVWSICFGCFFCERICPYGAIEREEIRDAKGNLIKTVAKVNEGLCTGCGLCAAACRANAITLRGFNDEQLFAVVNALGEEEETEERQEAPASAH